jgi:hypothetical protein
MVYDGQSSWTEDWGVCCRGEGNVNVLADGMPNRRISGVTGKVYTEVMIRGSLPQVVDRHASQPQARSVPLIRESKYCVFLIW